MVPSPPNDPPSADEPGSGRADASPDRSNASPAAAIARRSKVTVTVAALGVVYGDIGTSPLYTIREAFSVAGNLAPSEHAVLGVLSLVFWSLIVIVSIKYVILIMRADNNGEGGVLALAALAARGVSPGSRMRSGISLLAIFGIALFFGDGLITPAISVLSAVEGLNAATDVFAPYVVPAAGLILLLLFLIQSHGSGSVGKLFGPVMVVWFTVIGVLGLLQVIQQPSVLRALDPRYGITLFATQPVSAFVSLGAVVLAITGGEALYADMGHFGRPPIRFSWFCLVLPTLVLNYFGQGALVISDPSTIEHVFFLLAPPWALYPLVILSTLAAIIASQAVISGAFSLTRQAVQLGLLPRMELRHTSETEEGQVFAPRMNLGLLVGVLLLVSEFRSSANLAAAYGLAVTGVMAVSTTLAAIVARRVWGWRRSTTIAVFGSLLVIDLSFLAANLLKVPHGGWLPIVVGIITYVVVDSWQRGRKLLRQQLYVDALPLALFLDRIGSSAIRVPGTAIYMTGNLNTVPNALLHNLKHNHVMHQRIVLMTVITEDVPRVPDAERVEVDRLGKGFFTVAARFGFMEVPDVTRALEQCRTHGLTFQIMETSFFVGREAIVVGRVRVRDEASLRLWRKRLFVAMWNTSLRATAFFQIPPNRVVELGEQIEI
jgi:KUP system potassium uptake protein